jgi:hypothetical protein
MEETNLTQYCIKNGFCDEYSILNHGRLGASGHESKRAKEFEMKEHLKRQDSHNKGREQFIALVMSGDIVDLNKKFVKAEILAKEERRNEDLRLRDIEIAKGHVKFIKNLGSMSHMKSGKLRKGFQSQVDEHEARIKELTTV